MLIQQSARQLIRHLQMGAVTSEEVCGAFLRQIELVDPAIGAFLSVESDEVLEQAVAIDRRRAAGQSIGPLAGLPVAVKDLLCTKGRPTTCGSKMLEHYRPPYDATVVSRLRTADGIVIGKTNLDEFAMGGSTENSRLGETRNPWDLTKVPGGSSGGAAACVAARMAPLSIGTDTGGSIRQPASFCGVTGLKPTYGRVSRYGLVAFSSSLDQIGPLTNTVEDAALLLGVIAGPDPHDATCIPNAAPDYMATLDQPLKNLRLGIIREHFADGLNDNITSLIMEAIAVYRELGATLVDISLPHSRYGIATYYVIAPCEASSNLARYDGVHFGFRASSVGEGEDATGGPLVGMMRQTRMEGFGDEVKRRIMLGTYALSSGYYEAYYLKALKVRRLIRHDYDRAFEHVDFLVGPVTPTTAFPLGARTDDPLAMYLGDLFTVTTNLAGVAGISIPCGFDAHGLPVGLQLQARTLDEGRLLRAAHMFQQATDWHARYPTAIESSSD